MARRKLKDLKRRRHLARVERRRLRRIIKRRRHLAAENFDWTQVYGRCLIAAPRVIALEDRYHEEVAVFLRRLRDAVKQGELDVCIDFRKTENVAAGAMLLFYAELLRIRNLYPELALRCVPARNDVVAQVLKYLRIYELFGHKSSVVPSRPDVTSWRFASSDQVDGAAVGKLITEYKLDDAREKHLFRGASEAMINAVNHAYIADRDDGLRLSEEKKWWMFFRRSEGNLAVAVCDLGIGIPRSLPLKYPAEIIQSAMAILSAGKRPTDSRLIQAAMELQRTRTALLGRGKGLNDLRRIVDEVRGGKLFLFSNRGLVKYESGVFTRRNFAHSIYGTVVVWIIPLAGTPQ